MGSILRLKINRVCLIILTCFSTIGCDQITKAVAHDTLRMSSLTYWGGFFRLENAENPGSFLSMGAKLPEYLRFWFFTIFVGFAMAGVCVLLLKKSYGFWKTIGLSLILGGGLGNLLDRTLRSERNVIDFINIGIGCLRTGIFNMADVAILGGVCILLFQSFLEKEQTSLFKKLK